MRRSRFSPEVRDRAVRLVREHEREYPSQWAAITSVAQKMGCSGETLRPGWICAAAGAASNMAAAAIATADSCVSMSDLLRLRRERSRKHDATGPARPVSD